MKTDPYFSDFDIFVIGYPSSFFHSSYTVDELVEVARRNLDNNGIFSKHKHVYFLCRSMGGLVVRGYLTEHAGLQRCEVAACLMRAIANTNYRSTF
jgi:alpha-beta hydrolase superfamily lysophospholipase